MSKGEQLTENPPYTNITVSGFLKAANTAQMTFGALSGDILLTGPAPVGQYSQFVQKSRNKSLTEDWSELTWVPDEQEVLTAEL